MDPITPPAPNSKKKWIFLLLILGATLVVARMGGGLNMLKSSLTQTIINGITLSAEDATIEHAVMDPDTEELSFEMIFLTEGEKTFSVGDQVFPVTVVASPPPSGGTGGTTGTVTPPETPPLIPPVVPPVPPETPPVVAIPPTTPPATPPTVPPAVPPVTPPVQPVTPPATVPPMIPPVTPPTVPPVTPPITVVPPVTPPKNPPAAQQPLPASGGSKPVTHYVIEGPNKVKAGEKAIYHIKTIIEP